MRILLILTFAFTVSAAVLADDTIPFDGWVFPGAKLKEQSTTPITRTSADKKPVQSVESGLGQYLTEKPFHEVVAFYVRKSGLRPPNWSILGREYPGTDVHIPAHFSHTNFYREEPSITVLHYIREDVATAQVLVTDHPQLGFITVSITRGRNDDQTVIQLIQHSSKRIHRRNEQSDQNTQESSAAAVLNSEFTTRTP
ncbi:hypothetical protein [Novipirellula artificiosorum]|uniref:Uncharacterized protein n=1 Tax=Novipirellula artificiosorum TaxID=2528016 RepID=A0A5C6DV02_9BACT|nr:hypothetical protein [Novipirellula artificiosorum]TWU38599.1 hypothetical protein Poly41_30760 [Novipirellula artificiosorum]